jgi:DNA-binding transcriptional ArsR family regulator
MKNAHKTGKTRTPNRTVIKEEFVALTGSAVEAAILAQFESWQKEACDFDRFLEEEFERLNEKDKTGASQTEMASLAHGWICKSAEDISKEILFDISPRSVLRKINALTEKGYLLKRHDPQYKWNRAFQYRLNLKKITEDLKALGYEQGWRLWTTTST